MLENFTILLTPAFLIGLVFLLLGFLIFIKANLRICGPSEVLIFSGRQRKLKDSKRVGYKIVRGRGFRIPIIEKVYSMSLSTIPIEISIQDALAAGLIPVNLQGVGNIKLSSTVEEGLANAIERFMGKSPEYITQAAKEVLEGNFRGILAMMSPEEVNSKRLDFAKKVISESREDLKRLGLQVDTFKILNISEQHGYLEAIGRKKNAEVKKEASIAEAKAHSESRVAVSDLNKSALIAEKTAGIKMAEASNQLKVKTAQLDTISNKEEQKAIIAREITRVHEELKVEEGRVKLNQKKYEADKVIPSKAEREASENLAKGKASRILEDGKATAQAVNMMRSEWEKGNTKELFLIQQLPHIIGKITETISNNLHIDKLTVVDSGEGKGVPSVVKNITGSVVSVMEQVKNATGLDLSEILQKKEESSGKSLKKELD